MAVTRVNNFASADTSNVGSITSVAATYATANLTAGNWMFVGVFLDVASGTPATTAVSTGGGINFTKIYDSGVISVVTTSNGTIPINASFWIAAVGAAAGTKPTVTATLSGVANAGAAIGLEEVNPGTAGAAIGIDGTAAPNTSGTTATVTTPAYSDLATGELLWAWYMDQGVNNAPTNNGSGYTADNHVNNLNTQFILLSKASAGGSESTVTFTSTTNNALVAGMFALKLAFIAAPATIVGQGRTPIALTGVANSPTVVQSVRRAGYF